MPPIRRTSYEGAEGSIVQQELPFDASRRCGSCGGPAVDDELCQNCRDAFSSVLGHAASTSEPPDLYAQIEATGEPAPWVDTHFAATQFDVVETPSVAETDFAHAFESDAPIAVASVETFSPVETPAPVEAPA